MLAALSAPQLVRSLSLAEPATFSLIEGSPEMDARRKQQVELTMVVQKIFSAGQSRDAVEKFVEWVRGNDGGFVRLSSAEHQRFYDNASTLLPRCGIRATVAPYGL